MKPLNNEKPEYFSSEDIRNILSGRKTMMRRLVWPKSVSFVYRNVMDDIHLRITHNHYLFDLHHKDGTVSTIYGTRSKYFVGSRLWIREPFVLAFFLDATDNLVPAYKATWSEATKNTNLVEPRWRPSIAMPRWASRINLEVTSVNVERLQSITDDDCCRETGSPIIWPGPGPEPYKRNMRVVFQNYWNSNSINARRGYLWKSNPWVWVIEFKVI